MSVNGISALERGANQAPQRRTLDLLVKALSLDSQQRRALEEAAVRPSRPRTGGHAHDEDIPRPLTPFFGREKAVADAVELIATVPLVTLTGPGGIGKTRLALKIVQECGARFGEFAWIDLAALRNPESVLWALSARFGVKPAGDEGPLGALVATLRPRNALLVIDNCEHLVSVLAPAVTAILQSCPGVRIVATSRQPLDVPGEQIFRVSSLELEAAAELFIDRARRSSGAVVFSDGDRDAIGRIVTRLDGIALGIELAAARTNLLTLSQLEEALSERLHLLSGGSSMMLPRQQTMRAAIDWSYELLNPGERDVLDRLWIFPSSFSLDAVVAVCTGDPAKKWPTFEALASLVDKSLVESSPRDGTQRYRLLETTRAYAAERVDGPEEALSLRRRHAEFYCSFAESAAQALASNGSTLAWARSLETELENFRSALDWMLHDRNHESAGARLLSNLQEFWIVEGFAAPAAGQAQKILETVPDLPAELRAALWLTVARMRQELFVHPAPTLEAATNARELYEASQDRQGLAMAIRQQATAHMRMGAHVRAREELEQSLAIYRELRDERMVAWGLLYLASLLQVQGEHVQARATLSRVLELARAIGDDRIVPTASMNLAETEFALGDYASAADRAYENLTNEVLQKSCDMIATQESNLSVYLLALGRYEEARTMALASIADADKHFIAVPLQHLAASIAHAHPRSAATILGYVDEIFAATAFSRESTERFTYENLMSTLSASMDESSVAECRCSGAAMNQRQVLELAHGASAEALERS